MIKTSNKAISDNKIVTFVSVYLLYLFNPLLFASCVQHDMHNIVDILSIPAMIRTVGKGLLFTLITHICCRSYSSSYLQIFAYKPLHHCVCFECIVRCNSQSWK